MAFLPDVPLKMTSSIFTPRIVRADCSPSTQRIASVMLLLPLPFGPTTAVTPESNLIFTLSANDLKPCASIAFKYTISDSPRHPFHSMPVRQHAVRIPFWSARNLFQSACPPHRHL